MSRESITWKKWWRHVEGVASEDNGFSYGDDYWYFDVDPDDMWQEQIPDEGDSRYMHVDDLFDNKEDATEAAKEWCLEQEGSLIQKMRDLGIWNRSTLSEEDDAPGSTF